MFLVLRDFLKKNRTQGFTAQNRVSRRQHELHSFFLSGVFFILMEGKEWRVFTFLRAFSEQVYQWWIVFVCKIFIIWSGFCSSFVQWKCEIPKENRLSIFSAQHHLCPQPSLCIYIKVEGWFLDLLSLSVLFTHAWNISYLLSFPDWYLSRQDQQLALKLKKNCSPWTGWNLNIRFYSALCNQVTE